MEGSEFAHYETNNDFINKAALASGFVHYAHNNNETTGDEAELKQSLVLLQTLIQDSKDPVADGLFKKRMDVVDALWGLKMEQQMESQTPTEPSPELVSLCLLLDSCYEAEGNHLLLREQTRLFCCCGQSFLLL